MSKSNSVAKPAEPRPSGGEVQGALRNCDVVEIPIGVLKYLLDLTDNALVNVKDANVHLSRVHVDDEVLMDEVIEARGAALSAIGNLGRTHDYLNARIPEDES